MIYCVEDDSAIRDLMVYTLRASGFEAMGFENDTGFWAAMKEQRPEMIILDVMLPGAVVPCYIGYSCNYGNCKRQRV